MLKKKKIKMPFDFKPTKEQRKRIKKGCIVRRCQNCGKYFTTKIENQYYCHKCYKIKGKGVPEIEFDDLKRLY